MTKKIRKREREKKKKNREAEKAVALMILSNRETIASKRTINYISRSLREKSIISTYSLIHEHVA